MNITYNTIYYRIPAARTLILPTLAYPLLIVLNLALWAGLRSSGLELESIFTIAFMVSLVYLGLLESLLPFRRDWRPTGTEWLLNAAAFFPNGLLDIAGRLLASLIAIRLGSLENNLAFLLAVPLAIGISEFCAYWVHRLGHRVAWLWKIHGIHHLPGKVNLVNTNTIHFLDMLGTSLASALPLVMLGFSREAIALALFITGLHNFIVHVNADIRLGKLGYLLMGPAHHRLHHSIVAEEAQNYGTTLAIWDQLFGTFIPAHDISPRGVGVIAPDSFPPVDRVLQCQLHPFRCAGNTGHTETVTIAATDRITANNRLTNLQNL